MFSLWDDLQNVTWSVLGTFGAVGGCREKGGFKTI